MAPVLKSMAQKATMAPGTLIHVGKDSQEKVRISILEYTEAGVQEFEEPEDDQLSQAKEEPGISWFRVRGVHKMDMIQHLGDVFDLHPLVLEDLVNTHQRPKLEDYGDYLFMVLKALRFDDESKSLTASQVSVILGSGWVLSFEEAGEAPLEPVKGRIHAGRGRIRRSGADYLAYALLDVVVDGYFSLLEKMEKYLEDLEGDILEGESTENTLGDLYAAKRQGLSLRRYLWPLRELTGFLTRDESDLITSPVLPFLRDLYDHTVQVMEALEGLRDSLATLVDLHLNSVSNRMNQVMKVLTVIATIFIPITFVAGVYGMNFKFMPELDYAWAYPACLVLMAAVAGVMILYFHKKKWF